MEQHDVFEVTAVDDTARNPVEIIWYHCDNEGTDSHVGRLKYSSGRAAFLEMLYGEVGFVTNAWRESTLHLLEEIFPENSELEVAWKDLTPWIRFCLQQMTLGKQMPPIEYRAGIRLDRSELSTLYYKALHKSTEAVSMKTYQEICEQVIKYNLQSEVPDKEYMIFQDPDSMCNWLLIQAIKTSRAIRRCPVCKRYFFARNNQISCSTACKNIKNDLILFGDSSELAKKCNRLEAKVYSKIKSEQVFKFKNLSDAQDAAELKALCRGANIQLDGLLWRKQFKELSKVFHAEVKERCDHLNEVKISVLRGEISPTKESEAIEGFEDWLTKLDEQMRRFSFSRKNMSLDEAVEADIIIEQLRAKPKKE